MTELNRYYARCKRFEQNRLFQSNRRCLFEEIEGGQQQELILCAKKWLTNMERQLTNLPKPKERQNSFIHSETEVFFLKAKWKRSCSDGIQDSWLKNFTQLHERIVAQIDDYLQQGRTPAWMTSVERTLLLLKDRLKLYLTSHFRPIFCLSLIWKLMTGVITYITIRKLNI